LYKLFGVTKQACFKDVEHSKVLKLSQEAFALDFIKHIRAKDSSIGGRKLWYMYIREFQGNAPLGRDRFETLIDKYGLKYVQRCVCQELLTLTKDYPCIPT